MERIIEILKTEGPLTGKELLFKSNMEGLNLWRICMQSEIIMTKRFGKRYLRFDRNVEGYARLSPSIMREFYTYTVIGLKSDSNKIIQKANSLYDETLTISKRKFKLAEEIANKVINLQKNPQNIKDNACFIIAGDVVYDMAHSEPRPESSTGKLVKGSDLDIVIISVGLEEDEIKSIDKSVYNEKYRLLVSPTDKEEIDYVVKDISKVEEQLLYNSFKTMVASKILYEGKFLFGSEKIFFEIKNMLKNKKIDEKIKQSEKQAINSRNNASACLLEGLDSISEGEAIKLFYTKEEKEEFF